MTIDEIIRIVEWRMSEDVEKDMIISALRAGQAMRDKAKEFIHLAECDGDEDLIEAVEAWDAATKGDDK